MSAPLLLSELFKKGSEKKIIKTDRSILANSHSRLQSGQTDREVSQRWMQSRWNTWEQTPNAMLSPLPLLGDGLAWYSMEGSLRELRQIAQVSAQMSQDHMATAFHLRISKAGVC